MTGGKLVIHTGGERRVVAVVITGDHVMHQVLTNSLGDNSKNVKPEVTSQIVKQAAQRGVTETKFVKDAASAARNNNRSTSVGFPLIK